MEERNNFTLTLLFDIGGDTVSIPVRIESGSASIEFVADVPSDDGSSTSLFYTDIGRLRDAVLQRLRRQYALAHPPQRRLMVWCYRYPGDINDCDQETNLSFRWQPVLYWPELKVYVTATEGWPDTRLPTLLIFMEEPQPRETDTAFSMTCCSIEDTPQTRAGLQSLQYGLRELGASLLYRLASGDVAQILARQLGEQHGSISFVDDFPDNKDRMCT